MLDASLRSTHTYWPSTMIWVIFGFVGFMMFPLFTATTTPSREGAGISVIPGAEVQGKPECQEG